MAYDISVFRPENWDDETRVYLEKDQADEVDHVERWRRFLEDPGVIC